jgi:septum formation protein
MTPLLILGSGSPRRLDLLNQLGYTPHATVSPDINETPMDAEKPQDYVARLSVAKNEALGDHRHPNHVVLTADTIVACGRRILGKPTSYKDYESHMSLLSARRHRVMTSVSVWSEKLGLRSTLVQTHVQFKRLHDDEIAWYGNTQDWVDKAGGYSLQGPSGAFIKSIRGSYSSVIGLPLCQTNHLLKSAGLWIPSLSNG